MSAANPKSQEPSMEEILASIRRIIADDQEGTRAEAPPAWTPPAAAAPEEDEDDFLDLAEVAEPAPAKAPLLDLDPDDIGFQDSDPNQIDFDAIGFDDEPEPEPEPAPAPVFEEPEPEPAPVRAAAPEPPAGRLISGATDATVSQAFNMLAHTVLTNNARTLEDLVQDMLKPMLKAWLDDNLPTLVERLVRAEIERVARGGR